MRGGWRELTDNEVSVIRTILSSSTESEEERVRRSGIPRTSYRDAKQRIYAAGIIEDRYVPDPRCSKVDRISFYLAHAQPGRAHELAQRLAAVPGAVVVWYGATSVFGEIFHSSEGNGQRFTNEIVPSWSSIGETKIHLTIQPNRTAVPIYYDYEGAWSRFACRSGTKLYPRALSTLSPASWSGTVGRSVRPADVEELVRRPFQTDENQRSAHLMGPASLPRSKRRLVLSGVVNWRPFLVPEMVPEYHGWRITDVVFVYGVMKEPGGLRSLYQDLVGSCAVFPFLMASDDRQLLMASLSTGPTPDGKDHPRSGPRDNVTRKLGEHLSSFQFLREPLETLQRELSHRYDMSLPNRSPS